VNVTDKSVTVYKFPWKIDDYYWGPTAWTITIDENDNLWISIRGFTDSPDSPNSAPSQIPYLAKLEPENKLLYIYYIPREFGAGCDIKYSDGFVWYLTNCALSKIDPSTNSIVQTWFRNFEGGFMELDGDSIWMSSVSYGFVTRFNITSLEFDFNVTGFDRPLGIECDNEYVYVAENSQFAGSMGKIVRINKSSFQIDRLNTVVITNEGPYYVLKDSSGYLWYTDNSKHFGIANGVSFDSISSYCYFMTEVPVNSTEIWFSVGGSSYMGMKKVGTLEADINLDGVTNYLDSILLGAAFGSTQNDSNWNPKCDLNNDGTVNFLDAIKLGAEFGSTI
jgi:hypothetical protein